jgi:short-subunit dehydrogenase
MQQRALLIGNSDGIGLAATKRLLASGWEILGVSRSESPVSHSFYQHRVTDVCDSGYTDLIAGLAARDPIDLCVYFAAIGELLDSKTMKNEVRIFEVNLMGMIKTAAAVIPRMVERKKGHFIGLSSVADELISAEAPSYHASKAGFSNYMEGLALALRPRGVDVTNVRFGFVDTKMAKGDVKPFMMSVEKAVDHLQKCIDRKPVHYVAPRIVVPLVKFRKMMMKLGAAR